MRFSQQTEWLSMVDVSGPFLAVSILDKTFSQGLEAVESFKRKRSRSAYDEWCEAIDEADPRLKEYHREWTRLVLMEILGFDDSVMQPVEANSDSKLCYRSPDSSKTFYPDLGLSSGNGEKPFLLISIQPPGTDLEKVKLGDGWPASIVERMTLLCRNVGVRLGLVTNGERWMLVNAPIGSTSGHASWYARLWFQEPVTLQAFQSLLNVRRWFGPEDETLPAMLEDSLEHHEEVTDTLGEQVRRAVEVLVQCLDRADQDRNRELLREVSPAELYEAGLTVMMRLVFVLCAEERGLLLLGDPTYDQHYAISTIRGQLAEEADRHGPEVLERRHDAWSRLLSVFRAIYGGIEHENLRLPALGGSLFDPDRFPFLEGRDKATNWQNTTAKPLPIDNRTVLLLLNALQVLEHRGGALLLSYKALDVEQIGHVYEGLLEHTVRRMPKVTLGLAGSQKAKNPNIALDELEAAQLDGEKSIVVLIEDVTQRSESAIKNALKKDVDGEIFGKIVAECGGNIELANRIRPFAYLLRADAWGDFIVYRANSFAVSLGSDRRETGTHYTPKSLTESIVESTLEPIAYVGPAEGKAREKWQLKSSAELIDLKICDPAMGSGAFLVQVCRWLSERLVEAWGKEAALGKFISVDGLSLDEVGSAEPMPDSIDERLLIARRLVAERCLYGVDLNPLAVELAKLSIWLITLAKGRPFGFLDHNLHSGDSLLGIYNLEQLTEFSLHPETKQTISIFASNIEAVVKDAFSLRKQLREAPIRDIRDVQYMERLDRQVRQKLEHIEHIADAMIGETLASGGNQRAFDTAMDNLSTWAVAYIEGDNETGLRIIAKARKSLSIDLPAGKPHRKPFHWALEFPEVFERGGFDGIVGNPPFLGNSSWKSVLGESFQVIARKIIGELPGKIDLALLFHRHMYSLLGNNGCYGLLAPNNICEGTSVNKGLGKLLNWGVIYWSRRDMRWPGKASVVTSAVCFCKGEYNGSKDANGQRCEYIGPQLYPEELDSGSPRILKDKMYSFKGVDNSKGLAFVLTDDSTWFNPLKNEQNSLFRPYITGNDINSNALLKAERWALDIDDRSLSDIQAQYPIAHKFLMEVVKSTRTKNELKGYKGLDQRWWQFWNTRTAQLKHLRKKDQCVVFSRVTKHPICMLADPRWIYIEGVVLVACDRVDTHTVCLSSLFTEWLVARQGAKFGVGATLRLSIRDGVGTFPLPSQLVSRAGLEAATKFNLLAIEYCGEKQCGLTDFMNGICNSSHNDSCISEARMLMLTIDRQVALAYGWNDIVLERCFTETSYLSGKDKQGFVIPEDQRKIILSKLLKLNHERYDEEVAQGLHDKKKASTSPKKKTSLDKDDKQLFLF